MHFHVAVIFHVATLMPNKESDPNCNAKKLHIGNDYVTVVYNNSGEDYKIGVIKVYRIDCLFIVKSKEIVRFLVCLLNTKKINILNQRSTIY